MARAIHLEEGLRVRFPGRNESFACGVEIGMIAALMSLGLREFERQIGSDNLEQVRSVGRRLGYLVTAVDDVAPDLVRVTFRNRAAVPKLRVISSRA